MIDEPKQIHDQQNQTQKSNDAKLSPKRQPVTNNLANTFVSPVSPKVKKQTMSQMIHNYIKQSTSIHKERLERVEEANQILGKEYRSYDADLDKTKERKTQFNKQLDAMIAMLKQIDRVQEGIMECERNGKQIFDLLNKIQKKLNTKLQKKVEKLQKIKKTMRT